MEAVVFVSMTHGGAVTAVQKAKEQGLAPRSMGLAARRGEVIARHVGIDALSLVRRLPNPPRPEKQGKAALTAIEKRVLQAIFNSPGTCDAGLRNITGEAPCMVTAALKRFSTRGEAVLDANGGGWWAVAGTEEPGVAVRREQRRHSEAALKTIAATGKAPRGVWQI